MPAPKPPEPNKSAAAPPAAEISNRVALALAARSTSFLDRQRAKHGRPPPATDVSTNSSKPSSGGGAVAAPRDDDEDLFAELRGALALGNYAGIGSLPAGAAKASARPEDRALRAMLLGRAGRGRGRADVDGAGGRRVEESSSDDEGGRTSLGKRKRVAGPRAVPVTLGEGQVADGEEWGGILDQGDEKHSRGSRGEEELVKAVVAETSPAKLDADTSIQANKPKKKRRKRKNKMSSDQ